MFSLLVVFGFCAIILKVVEGYVSRDQTRRELQTAFVILFVTQLAIILLHYINKDGQ